MAKRGNDTVGTLFIGGIVLLGVAVLLAPLAILIGLIYFEFKSRPPEEEFGLTFAQAAELQEAEDEIRNIDIRLDEIEDEGDGLSRTNDGSYDRRTKLGRALSKELEQLSEAKERLEETADELRYGPLDAWNRLLWLTSMRAAMRWTAIGYAVAALVLYLMGKIPLFALPVGLVLLAVSYWVKRTQTASSVAPALAVARRLAAGGAIPPELLIGGSSNGDSSSDYGQDESAETSEEQASATVAPHKAWYEILGVSADASADDINAAWRDRIKKAHPDLVAELDSDFQELAEAKAKDINAARAEGLSAIERRGADHRQRPVVPSEDQIFWERKGSPESRATFEAVLSLIKEAGREPRVSYNQNHITAGTDGRNFLWFSPNTIGPGSSVTFGVGEKERSDFIRRFNNIDIVAEPRQANGFRVNLSAQQVTQHQALLNEVIKVAGDFSHR